MGALRTYANPSRETEATAIPAEPTAEAGARSTGRHHAPAALLRFVSPGWIADPSQRARMFHDTQQHYGNRAVQRFIASKPVIQRKCACSGSCTSCKEEEELRRAGLQRKAAGPASRAADTMREISHSRGGGQLLASRTRTFMESSFGRDFSGVRIHTGAQANHWARMLNAQAFTTGRDIFFAPSKYAPNTTAGKRLLAHELTHVVQQQRTASLQQMTRGVAADAFEQEADTMAEAVRRGKSAHVTMISPVMPATAEDPSARFTVKAGEEKEKITVAIFVVDGKSIRVVFDWKKPRKDPKDDEFDEELVAEITPQMAGGTVLKKLKQAAAVVTEDKKVAEKVLLEMQRLGIYSQPAAKQLLLSFAKLERGTVGPATTFLRRELVKDPFRPRRPQASSITSAMGKPPATEEVRHRFVERGPTREGEQRTSLSPFALVFYEAIPGQFRPRPSQPTEQERFPFREYVFEGAGGPLIVGLGIVQVGGKEDGRDEGKIIEIIEVHERLGRDPQGLLRLMSDARWPISDRLLGTKEGGGEGAGGTLSVNLTFSPRGIMLQLPRNARAGGTVRITVPRNVASTTIPGLDFREATFTLGPDMRPTSGRLVARPTLALIRQRVPEVTFAVDATARAHLDMRAPFRMRPFGDAEIHFQSQEGQVSARATITPRPRFLRNARGEMIYENGELRGGVTFTSGALQLPIPGLTVENVRGGITFTNEGISGEGGATLKYRELGQADIIVRSDNRRGLTVEGPFVVSLPGIQPVPGKVKYQDNKLTGEVTLREKDFPEGLPLEQGTSVTVRLVDGRIEASARGGIRLGRVGRGKFTFNYENGRADLGAGIQLDIAGLRGSTMRIYLRQHGLEGELDIPISSERLPGLSGILHAWYREGHFGGEARPSYRKGSLVGTAIVRLQQLEDGSLAISGGGDVSARITPWLVGTVHVEITPAAEVNVQGEIRAPNEVPLFPPKPIGENKPFPRVTIPLFGFSIPVVGHVGLVAFIEGGVGFTAFIGPGVLRNITVVGSFSTQEEQTPAFDISGEFYLPAGAEATFFIAGGISLGALVAEIEGSIRLDGGLGAQASLSVFPHIGYANGDYYFRGNWELQALAYLRLSGKAEAAIRVGVWRFKKRVWYDEWPLANWVFPLGLNVGLSGRMDYTFGRPFEPRFKFEKGELDPMSVAKAAIPGPGQSPRSGPDAPPAPRAQMQTESVPGARAATPDARPTRGARPRADAVPATARPAVRATAARAPRARAPVPMAATPARPTPAARTMGSGVQLPRTPGAPTPATPTRREAVPIAPQAPSPVAVRPTMATPAPSQLPPAPSPTVPEAIVPVPARPAAPAVVAPVSPAAVGPAAPSPAMGDQVLSLAVNMAGELHRLFISIGPAIKLEMESRRELLSNKIGRAVAVLHAERREAVRERDEEREGQLNGQIAWLTDIGRRASQVQRQAIQFGTSPRGPLDQTATGMEIVGFSELAEQIRSYSLTYRVKDIEGLIEEHVTRSKRQELEELLRVATHIPCSQYGKHCRGRTNEERRQNSTGGGAGQYFDTLGDEDIMQLERQAFRDGRLVKRGGDSYHCFYRFPHPIGYADGEETHWMRVELSGRAIHSHPRPSGA
jgi:Domain of unknown function (DUF4157)